jgi:hypothetical protein
VKRLLLCAALLTAATPVRPAAAAEMFPSQFHGRWCQSKWQTIYRLCRRDADEWAFTINRATLTTEESTCTLLAIRKQGVNTGYGSHAKPMKAVGICPH